MPQTMTHTPEQRRAWRRGKTTRAQRRAAEFVRVARALREQESAHKARLKSAPDETRKQFKRQVKRLGEAAAKVWLEKEVRHA